MTTLIEKQAHACSKSIRNGLMITICDKQCEQCKSREDELE